MIVLQCNTSLSITNKWTIKSCTSSNCSIEIQLNKTVNTTWSELYIPSKTLPYGTYQLTLTVTMTNIPNLKSSSSVYITIIPSSIIVNLVQLGPSMITHGNQQNLLLDPGTFSIDPDQNIFNATVSNNIFSSKYESIELIV